MRLHPCLYCPPSGRFESCALGSMMWPLLIYLTFLRSPSETIYELQEKSFSQDHCREELPRRICNDNINGICRELPQERECSLSWQSFDKSNQQILCPSVDQPYFGKVRIQDLCYKSGSNCRTQVSGLVQNTQMKASEGFYVIFMSPDMQVNCKISSARPSRNRISVTAWVGRQLQLLR